MPRNIVKNYANGTTTSRTNLVKNRVFEAQTEARNIVADAEAKSAQIIADAHRQADELRETAYREGREQAVAEFTETIAAALERRETAVREVEQDVLKLSVKLAEKIIGREIKTDKKTVADIVATALRNVRHREQLIIRVNPADFPQLEEIKSTFSHTGRAEYLDFEPDPKIASGGCLIESEVGTVDARLETQLKILERALLRQSETEES